MAEELKSALPIEPPSEPRATSSVHEPIELHDFVAPAPLFGQVDGKDGWEVVLDKKVDPSSINNIEGAELLQIWKRPAPGMDPKLGITQWRSVGTCPVPAETYFNVQWDLDYHRHWDDYCLQLDQHSMPGHTQLLYWKAKFPW
jgi:hypothetical protein